MTSTKGCLALKKIKKRRSYENGWAPGAAGWARGVIVERQVHAGHRLASVWRVAVAAGPRAHVGARGTWSTKPGASCKPRASLTAQEGVSACEAQHQTVRTGDSCPPWQRANGPGAKGRGRPVGLGRERARCVCPRPGICRVASLHPRWGQCAQLQVRLRRGWTVTPYPGVPLARANGPSGSERSRPRRPLRCFEGQKENALQSRP